MAVVRQGVLGVRAAAGVGQRPGRVQGQGRRETTIDQGSDLVLSIISRTPRLSQRNATDSGTCLRATSRTSRMGTPAGCVNKPWSGVQQQHDGVQSSPINHNNMNPTPSH